MVVMVPKGTAVAVGVAVGVLVGVAVSVGVGVFVTVGVAVLAMAVAVAAGVAGSAARGETAVAARVGKEIACSRDASHALKKIARKSQKNSFVVCCIINSYWFVKRP